MIPDIVVERVGRTIPRTPMAKAVTELRKELSKAKELPSDRLDDNIIESYISRIRTYDHLPRLNMQVLAVALILDGLARSSGNRLTRSELLLTRSRGAIDLYDKLDTRGDEEDLRLLREEIDTYMDLIVQHNRGPETTIAPTAAAQVVPPPTGPVRARPKRLVENP